MKQVSRGIGAAALTAIAVGASVAPAEAAPCVTPEPLTFGQQTYVDNDRAGGEPLVQTHPSGALLYTAHAGTTHYYTPASADPDTEDFFKNYQGQTYIWRSEDQGQTWSFSPRIGPRTDKPGEFQGLPMSGFSDSELAIDTAGNLYESEINLVNVAVSKSTDVGKTWTLQNFFGFTMTDRQWKAADEENVLYMVGNGFGGGTFPTEPAGKLGHMLVKSVDGGKTFSAPMSDRGGVGDIYVDQSDGRLFETVYSGNELKMRIFRNIRGIQDPKAARAAGVLDTEDITIAEGVSMLAHWPSMDIDTAGNVYVTWDESGRGAREAGIYYASSNDRGESWSEPIRVDVGPETDIWPWITVGDPGRVAIAWFGGSTVIPRHDTEDAPANHEWRMKAAVTTQGLGCDDGPARFTESVATPSPVHKGTVCQQGTVCQAQLIDRRLGDFMSIDATNEGDVYMGYSDTAKNAATALPGFVKQTGGPKLFLP